MVSLFVLFLNTGNADITTSYFGSVSCGICWLDVRIQGNINKSDLEALKKKIAEAPNRCNEVNIVATLDSLGGDIEAAMGIGQLFRKHEAQVGSNRCYSACIYLVAGAVRRWIMEGTLGIHRPYFYDSKNLTGRDMEMRYKNMLEQIRNYFRKMNIPEALADAMISVPPGEIEILTYDKAKQFLLTQTDPVHEELEIARASNPYGLTSSEWRKRSETADTMCKGGQSKFRPGMSLEEMLAEPPQGLEQSKFKPGMSLEEMMAPYVGCFDRYTLNLSPKQSRYFKEQRNKCEKEQRTREGCQQCAGRAYRDAMRIAK
jgi:ATP-dependent protease ClpP protease subunit